MYALVTQQGAFLFPTKEGCIALVENQYSKLARSMYGWLFWTCETLDLLLEMDCKIIIDKTLEEVTAKEFVEAFKKVQDKNSCKLRSGGKLH